MMATKKMTVAEYLTAQINLCGKTQLDIAREVGFEKPNIITMLKQGKSKLPISRIGKLAKSLGVDPWYLYQLAMSEYEPDTWSVIEEDILRGQPVLTENEKEILALLRSCRVPNPKVRTLEERERLLSAFNRLRPDNVSAG
jgi:transcriptional regulator with XRE-family HTH domain